MEFVSWDYYSQLNGKIKHVPNHQPDTCGRKLFTRRVEDPVVSDWSSPPMRSIELGYPFLTDHNQLGYIVNVWVPIIHGLTNNDCWAFWAFWAYPASGHGGINHQKQIRSVPLADYKYSKGQGLPSKLP